MLWRSPLPQQRFLTVIDRCMGTPTPAIRPPHCFKCGILIGPGHLEAVSIGGYCRSCAAAVAASRRN